MFSPTQLKNSTQTYLGDILNHCVRGETYFNYANQRPAQRPPLLAPFRYQRPFSFSAKGRLAHVFAVAEGLKTCFRVRKMVQNKFPRKNRVFPRKIAIFTQKNVFFRDFCGTKAFGGSYQRRDIYQRLFLLAPFFIQRLFFIQRPRALNENR